MSGALAILSIIRRFAGAYRWRLAAGVLLVAGALAAGVGLLAVSGQLIAGAALAGLGLIAFELFGPSAAIRFFAIARTATRYVERLATHDATLRFLADLRVGAFRGLVVRYRGTQRPGILFNRLTGDLDSLDGVLIRLAVPVAAGVLVLAGATLAFASVDAWLAVATIVPLAVGGIFAPLFIATRTAAPVRRKLMALDAARLRIVDLDRGRAALAASGHLAAQTADVADAFDRVAAADRQLARLDGLLRVVSGAGAHASVVGASVAAAALAQAGELSGLGVTAAILAAFALAEIVAPMRGIALDYGRWSVAAQRLAPIIEADPVDPRDADPAGDGRGVRAGSVGVSLTRVTMGEPGASSPRLSDVSLTLGPGSMTALVGPSGAGKSTLLALIAGALQPDRGTVDYPGHREPDLRPRIAWLGQRTELFRGTVAENLRLADPIADDETLRRVLCAAGLWDALGPAPLERRLGDEGSGLSGGERRRLALARLMLMEAEIVLVDEPTEGLDAAGSAAAFGALRTWARGRTLVYATHRPDEAALADLVVHLSEGRIVGPASLRQPV